MDTISFPDPTLLRDGSSSQYLWLDIKPMVMAYDSFQTTSSVSLSETTATDVVNYRFLLPKDIPETINHVWSPMESIYMKINQKIASIAQSIEQGNAVFRVDTPLLYATTENRSITIQFYFVFYGSRSSDPYYEVVEPILNLKKWAAPQKSDEADPTSPIELPYVFTLKTVDGGGSQRAVININAAAITSIQSTFKGPYHKGSPTYAELLLTFTDIEPNYKDSYRNITTINADSYTSGPRDNY